jgi:PilZ domain
LEAQGQPVDRPSRNGVEDRHHPRFKIETDITINSRSCGRLKGHTVDISRSGLSAMLRIEVSRGDLVELNFALPLGPVKVLALVRQQNAFRYGFQFMEENQIIRSTCDHLEMERSLSGEL